MNYARMTNRFKSQTYHHLVEGNPAVRGKILQHGHQKLQASVPVTQQQHHPDQVKDPHDSTRKVISHVKDLMEKESEQCQCESSERNSFTDRQTDRQMDGWMDR